MTSLADDESMNSRAYADGLRLRKQVLGEGFVDRALDCSNFAAPMQDFVTSAAWGSVWNREGLDLRARSIATVALLTALGKSRELKAHVRGALANGVSPSELRELFLHSALYCGIPAASEALAGAEEVLRQYGPDGSAELLQKRG